MGLTVRDERLSSLLGFVYCSTKFQLTTINLMFIAFTEKDKETRGTVISQTHATVCELWLQGKTSITWVAVIFMTYLLSWLMFASADQRQWGSHTRPTFGNSRKVFLGNHKATLLWNEEKNDFKCSRSITIPWGSLMITAYKYTSMPNKILFLCHWCVKVPVLGFRICLNRRS